MAKSSGQKKLHKKSRLHGSLYSSVAYNMHQWSQ